jgi:uncharacterized protein (TIGR03086 family)
MIDLAPTAERTISVVTAVRDDQLEAPTPTGQPVRVIVHHLLGLSTAFRDAAGKVDGPTTSTPPAPEEGPLPDGWRDQVHRQLGELASAWRSDDAWTGMTKAGGVPLPGEICGLVALDEVLLHGWDVARATGQPYQPTEPESEAVLPVVTPSPEAADGSGREGLFGPVVAVPKDAPVFDRVLGLAGRDPAWAHQGD